MASLVTSIIVDLTNIVLNTSLAHIIWKVSKIGTISYRLMFSLSISDVAVGLSGLVLHSTVLALYSQNVTLNSRIQIPITVHTSFIGFSARGTFLIAIDRFVHMKYLTRYNLIMTKRKASILMCANVMLFLMEMSTIIFPDIYANYYIIATFIHVVTAFVSVLLYMWALLSIKSRIDNSCINQTNVQSIDKHLERGVLIIVVCLIVCYTPPLAGLICKVYLQMKIPDSTISWMKLLILLKSSSNAVILSIFNREVKRCWKQKLCC